MNINNIINTVSSGAEAADDYSLLLEYRISHYPFYFSLYPIRIHVTDNYS